MKDIEFISKITAIATHELKNVFASIKECAGIMEDLLGLDERQIQKHLGRISESLSAVRDQLQRADVIATSLNKFVHSVESENGEVEIAELLTHLINLTQRIVRQRQTKIFLKGPKTELRAKLNPFILHMAGFLTISGLLRVAKKGSEIIITAKQSEGETKIRFDLSGVDEQGLEGIDLNPLLALSS
ncbi:MAG: hypothetical protein ACK4WB_05455 [Desulfatiglandales bacterium]